MHGLVWIRVQVIQIVKIKRAHDCSYNENISWSICAYLWHFLLTREDADELSRNYWVNHDKINHLSISFLDIIRNGYLRLRRRFKHVNLRDLADASRLSILSTEEVEKLVMKLNVGLRLNCVTFSSCFSSMLQETQIFTFSKALIHNWSSFAHKLLQIKRLISPLIFLSIHIFIFIVVVIVISWCLIKLILLTTLLSLNFLIYIVISCR